MASNSFSISGLSFFVHTDFHVNYPPDYNYSSNASVYILAEIMYYFYFWENPRPINISCTEVEKSSLLFEMSVEV